MYQDRIQNQILIGVILISLVGILTPAGIAQSRSARHSGFYIGYGLGYGSCRVDFSGGFLERSQRTYSAEGTIVQNLRFGWAVTQNLLVGIESNACAKQFEFGRRGFTNLSAGISLYHRGLFVKGGPALTLMLQSGGWFDVDSEEAIGFMLGVGAELRLTKRFAVVPSVQWTYHDFEHLTSNIISLVVGIGWFW